VFFCYRPASARLFTVAPIPNRAAGSNYAHPDRTDWKDPAPSGAAGRDARHAAGKLSAEHLLLGVSRTARPHLCSIDHFFSETSRIINT